MHGLVDRDTFPISMCQEGTETTLVPGNSTTAGLVSKDHSPIKGTRILCASVDFSTMAEKI